MSLHLDNIEKRHSRQVVEDIKERAIFLFYRNERRIRHNLQRLSEVHTHKKTVAVLKTVGTGPTGGKSIATHFQQDAPESSMLCIGAKVALENKNFRPSWGLHNGACGIVEEIVYAKDHTPTNSDLPKYVVVNFPLYCGPAWDRDNPQSIPIPPSSFFCDRCHQCKHRYIPLTLAYTRTIHKFQCQSAGPVDEGKIPNMFEVIVCDPDENQFEGKALGLFYTTLSRATTLGDDDGLNSAIYFTGKEFREDRVRLLGKKKNGTDNYLNVKRRDIWVAHLETNTRKNTMTEEQLRTLANWAESTKYSYDTLHT